MRQTYISNRQRKGIRRGIALVEFALIAPVFFLFVLAGIEFGRVNMVRGTLGNAAYEGARRAIIPGATAQDAEDAAIGLLEATWVNGVQISVSPSVITDETEQVTVAIEVDLDQNTWIAPMFTQGITLSNSRTLEREKYNTEILAGFDPGATTGEGDSGGDTGGGSGSGSSGSGSSSGGGWGGSWPGGWGGGGGWGGRRGGGRRGGRGWGGWGS